MTQNLYEGHSEAFLQKHVLGRLNCLARMGCLLYERRNAGKAHGCRLGMPGMADVVIYLKGGKTLFVELKKPISGRLNNNQLLFKERIEALGFEYFIIVDTKHLDTILGNNGIRI